MAVPPSKPFFFRLEPSKLLSALIQVPEQERGDWITRAAVELATGNPTLEFTKSLFEEAEEFKQQATKRSRLAGLASAERRKQRKSTDVQQKSTDVQQKSTDVQQKSTDPNPVAVAVTETIQKPYKEILDDLNSKGGFSYRPGKAVNEFINGRLAEGFTKEDFFHVHTVMVAKWKDDEKMSQYLRPSTLYRPTHFQEYLNQKLITSKCITPDWM
jgi:uncharacterized phage protein (TIGR02220 family)